jgi:ketosteroid isomerase-like protein
MSDQQYVQKVQELYGAFGRGDIATIVDALADDVTWTGTTPWNANSTTTTYRGKAGVQQFFSDLDAQVNMTAFEPKEFTSSGDLVVALGTYTGGPKGGETCSEDWAMAFWFRSGKLVKFQEYSDTTRSVALYKGSGAAAR